MSQTLHEKIKKDIVEAMRAKNVIRLEVLRGLQSLFMNELIAQKSTAPFLKGDAVLAIIKRSVKQRKDSIEQFTKGGRKDLATKEESELKILEEFLPKTMSHAEIKKVVEAKLKKQDGKPDKAKIGQFIGSIMKELAGKADGADVKAVVDDIISKL